jgi:hypothetical protein
MCGKLSSNNSPIHRTTNGKRSAFPTPRLSIPKIAYLSNPQKNCSSTVLRFTSCSAEDFACQCKDSIIVNYLAPCASQTCPKDDLASTSFHLTLTLSESHHPDVIFDISLLFPSSLLFYRLFSINKTDKNNKKKDEQLTFFTRFSIPGHRRRHLRPVRRFRPVRHRRNTKLSRVYPS